MTRGARLGLIAGVLVAVAAGVAWVGAQRSRNKATEVRMETVGRRDLVATVTASGRIKAKAQVDISADVTGRILEIAVKEGELVRKGQFLMRLDPVQFEGAVSRGEAALASAEAAYLQARVNRDQSKRQYERAVELQKAGSQLVAPEAVEQARQAFDVAEALVASSRAQVEQARAGLKEARDNLARTRLYAPISGRVVRLAVEEGEVAVPGTFSKDVGLLMTIADLSVIQAMVDVDETDVVRLTQGDSVQVTIDAYPDTTFAGRVTMVKNSAKRAAATAGTNDRAVDFEVEVTLDDPPADIRPDLSCTARIVTDTRTQVLSVPIIALTVREHEVVPTEAGAGVAATPAATPAPAPGTPADSAARKTREKEGVFVVNAGVATFRPVKVGIAGEEYFEVLDGVREGETIVAGPYQAIRDLKDGAKVKPQPAPAAGQKGKAS